MKTFLLHAPRLSGRSAAAEVKSPRPVTPPWQRVAPPKQYGRMTYFADTDR